MIESTPQNLLKSPTCEDDLNANPLRDKQSAALEMLATGRSFQAVADTLKVDRRTIYAWRQDPDFQHALTARRRELFASVNDRIRGLLDESIDVIEQQLRDRYDRARFRAAATLLRLAGLNKSINPDNE